MIHISQGHENSIGLEVLLKSLICLPQKDLHFLKLHCFKDTLETTLNSIHIKYEIFDDKLIINDKVLTLKLLKKNSLLSETLISLESTLKSCSTDDILLTLPSSKDQFQKNNSSFNGHTEFFRTFFSNSNLSMAFIGPINNVLLLTDHIPISQVASSISSESVLLKVSNVLDNIGPLRSIRRVIFSGINPHCGEDGLMGNEESSLYESIKILKNKYEDIEFLGPISADTLQFFPSDCSDLLVYSSHDQGLAPFKTINGLLGINTTFGLPFLRVSPDHGTAFHLYGKNSAHYQGMLFVLKEILKLQNKKALE